jgi:hypothetical protein
MQGSLRLGSEKWLRCRCPDTNQRVKQEADTFAKKCAGRSSVMETRREATRVLPSNISIEGTGRDLSYPADMDLYQES